MKDDGIYIYISFLHTEISQAQVFFGLWAKVLKFLNSPITSLGLILGLGTSYNARARIGFFCFF